MSLSLEDKIRLLASTDPVLQSYLGTAPFRLYDRQLFPGAIEKGACVTVERPSTVGRMYSQYGLLTLSQPRITFRVYTWTGTTKLRVLANAPAVARTVKAALINWLATQACFSSSAQFDSPTSVPPNHPNFVLNEISGLNYKLDPPGYIELFDVRIMNLEN